MRLLCCCREDVEPLGVDRLLGGTTATALTGAARPLTASRCRIVILAANVVPQARWLRALRESEIETERLYADAGATAVIDTDEPAAVESRRRGRRGRGAAGAQAERRATYP